MKKVLFLCPPNSYFYEPVTKALLMLGFAVYHADFRGNPILNTNSILHKIVKRLPGFLSKPLTTLAQKRTDAEIVAKARRVEPDYILSLKAKELSIETLDELRAIATTINWYPDTMNNWGSIEKIAGHYDHFFSYDDYVVGMLKQQGHEHIYYLPLATDLDKGTEWPERTKYEYDVIFLGSFHRELYPERETFLNAIKDLGLYVWGNKAWETTSLKDYFHGPVVPNHDIILALYGKSKVVVHSDLITDRTAGTGITLRPFDVTAAGSLLLAHNDRKELFDLFKDGEEFVSFNNEHDLREKLIYYLKHEDERIKIAKAGFIKTLSTHTFFDRVKELFDVVQQKTP